MGTHAYNARKKIRLDIMKTDYSIEGRKIAADILKESGYDIYSCVHQVEGIIDEFIP